MAQTHPARVEIYIRPETREMLQQTLARKPYLGTPVGYSAFIMAALEFADNNREFFLETFYQQHAVINKMDRDDLRESGGVYS